MNAEWVTLLDKIIQLQANIEDLGNPAWFRGQRKASWPLTSCLHRKISDTLKAARKEFKPAEYQFLLREEAKSLYRLFKSDAWPLLEEFERRDWPMMFSMQHHGIQTRLLDWSESFAVALYFAQDKREAIDDAAIFVLNPAKLNEIAIGISGLIPLDDETGESTVPVHNWHPKYVPPDEDLPTIAVVPVLTNRRMVAQQSAFTVSGDSFESLDTLYPSAVTKIVLPAETFPDAQNLLRIVGAGPFQYFPDLEGLRQKFETRHQKTIKGVTRPPAE
jgi:FRG domain-containing protein